MPATSPANVDFSPLEDDPRFRAACLRFLQLANTYIAQVFFQTFNDGKRCKQLYEWLDSVKGDADWTHERGMSQSLYRNIVPAADGHRSGYLDVYDADFAHMLYRMETELPGAANRFYRNLNLFHAVPLRPRRFLRLLETLRQKRNCLKDYERRRHKGRRPDDNEVIEAFGLLLLPILHQHFLGAVSSANARARRAGRNAQADIRAIDFRFRQARKRRAEATEQVFGARKRGLVEKKRRKDAEEAKQKFMRLYRELYPEGAWPRYNYHRFRIRIAFIGGTNMRNLRRLTGKWQRGWHFSRDIEPLYNTAMAVNNLLDEAFWHMAEADDRKVERLRREEKLSKKRARARLGADACLNAEMRPLRNHVAHNGLFCFFKPPDGEDFMPAREVFRQVFAALLKPHAGGPEVAGELYSRLRALLEKQDYVWVFRRNPENPANDPPIVIRHWTAETRARYGDHDRWRLDRRLRPRRICAHWNRALQEAWQQARQRRGA